MPNIRQYTNPVDQIHPTEMGSAAFELEGRHIGADIDAAGRYAAGAISKVGGEYAQGVEQSELASVAKNYSSADVAIHQDMQDFFSKADPTDPNVAQKWFDARLEPALQKLNQTTDGMSRVAQNHAREYENQLRNTYRKAALADQSGLAGIGVVQALKTTDDNYQTMVAHDPSMLDHALDARHGVLEAQLANPNLNAEQREQIRAQHGAEGDRKLAISAIYGGLNSNPKQVLTDLQAGKYDKYGLNGGDIHELIQHASTAVEQKDRQQLADEARAEREQSKQWDGAATQLRGEFTTEDGQFQVPKNFFNRLRALSLLPGAKEGVVGALQEQAARIEKGEMATHTDPKVWNDLFSRAQLDEHDPNALNVADVVAAEHSKSVSTKDATMLLQTMRGMATDKQYKTALGEFKRFINNEQKQPMFAVTDPVTGFKDETAVDRFNMYRSRAQDMFDQAYKGGADWRAALDPNNTQFLGKMRDTYSIAHKGITLPNSLYKQPGMIEEGRGGVKYRFKGGDALKQENYERIK